MSFTKKDRNFQPYDGKVFPEQLQTPIGSGCFARIIADALHSEFGGTNAAVKLVMSLTAANERAVKNWFSAKNGPSGPHLIVLARRSEKVLETFLVLAGRPDLLKVKKLTDARIKLQEMLRLLDEVLGQ